MPVNLHNEPHDSSSQRSFQPNGHGNGGIDHGAGPFDEVARTLLENGYAPIPLIGKRPIEPQWSKWSRRQPTGEEIAAGKGKGRNVGVATGLGKLIAIDIDSDDKEVEVAVRSIIGESTVAKRGQRGRTDFYRMPTSAACPSRQFRHKDTGKVLVEVLGEGRQSAIPPSIHPVTKAPYTWLTDATLLDTCIDDLPECPADLIERLEAALKPWLPEEKPARPQRVGIPPTLTDAMKKRHRAWALKAIDARAKDLATKNKPGRNRALFEHAAALGRFVHHGIIGDAEMRDPLIEACVKNGLVEENGCRDCEKTIDKGLRYALPDHLEDLPERDQGSSAKTNGSGPSGSADWRTSSAKAPTAPALEFDDQITVDTQVYALVKGVLHPGDIAAAYGPSMVGKTFLTLDLGYHVALGRAWHGRRVRQHAVLYVGLEGQMGLRNRMLAAKERFGSAGRMFARLTLNPLLAKGNLGNAGEKTIIAQAKLLEEAAGQKVGLIILDTKARAMAGDDEDRAQDNSAYLARKQRIAIATGAAVLSVHHPGKDDTRGMRGSNSFFAACDAVIKISGSDELREIATEKVKEGISGPLFSFRLKRVVLGIDQDGDAITSCTVEQVDAGGSAARKRPKADSAAGRALNELDHLLLDGNFTVSNGHNRIPDGAQLIKLEDWRRACRKKRLSPGGKGKDTEGRTFRRAVRDLSAANLIGHYDKWVWPIRGQSGQK